MAKYVGISIKPYNDIELDATGNLKMVYDAEAVGQHARQRLSFFKGEWFLDPSVGVDWFGRILGGLPSLTPLAEAIVKATILKTPGVTAINSIDTVYDSASRGAQVRTCEVETEFDTISF